MNFLILSVTAGEGHNSTARAIRTALEAQEADAEILDTLEYVSPELAKVIADGYLMVTERAQGAYRIGYRLAETRRAGEKLDAMQLATNALSKELVEYIRSDRFDAVVFTHPFAGMMCSTMKRRGLISNRTVGILTDFTFHPFWEDCTANDYVVTPDRLLLPQARRKGFRDEQILPFGIPINPKFSERVPAEDARRQVGLDPALPTFLVMGGSMGYGNMGVLVSKIASLDVERDFQIIAVAGRNEEAKTALGRLAEKSSRRILVTGFVDYVSLLMDAADCIITKPGGLTTSESLAKNLPMIIVNPIPGQEERNTEFLLNNGCAMATTKTAPIEECIYQLLMSDVRLEAMKSCIAGVAKPHATEDLTKFLINLAHTPEIG
ncbi:MAG: galactosyldiacylglycerol synthase [Clostridia bacterium]|nr:galactosyldiacylglycerol synthase [Clostridia bacterium]